MKNRVLLVAVLALTNFIAPNIYAACGDSGGGETFPFGTSLTHYITGLNEECEEYVVPPEEVVGGIEKESSLSRNDSNSSVQLDGTASLNTFSTNSVNTRSFSNNAFVISTSLPSVRDRFYFNTSLDTYSVPFELCVSLNTQTLPLESLNVSGVFTIAHTLNVGREFVFDPLPAGFTEAVSTTQVTQILINPTVQGTQCATGLINITPTVEDTSQPLEAVIIATYQNISQHSGTTPTPTVEDTYNIHFRLTGLPAGVSCTVESGATPSLCNPQEFAYNARPSKCPNGCDTSAGNPINFSLGYKYQTETDFQSENLEFMRYYRSDADFYSNSIGQNWRHNFDRSITEDSGIATVIQKDGLSYDFELVGGNWEQISDDVELKSSLVSTVSGYTYTTEQNNKEYYDTNGRLERIEYLAGDSLDFAYDASSRLINVTDENGRSLSFTYNANDQIDTLTTPDGVFSYSYDANLNLTQITKPDTTTRIYHYENASFLNALTGITDENSVRVSTYGYDANGRAISSENAGGVNRFVATENPDESMTIENPLGKLTDYQFSTIQGVRRVTSMSHQASALSPAWSETMTYDSEGRLETMTDGEGNLTRYSYDTRGLEISRVEAEGSSVERTITTTWDANFRLPDVITETGRTTDHDYDTFGRVTQITITDTGTSDARTTTFTYHPNTTDGSGNTVLGRLASIDGSRTDVTDTTSYLYDANFNVTKITNALGHETDFTSYDSAGRPLTLEDENDVTTTFTYDSLGRVLTQTHASRTTTYTYEDNGLLSTLSLPDGRQYTYSYDNAQRLTSITSVSGESTEYTLDNAGNRTEEILRNSSGEITNRDQFTFDELSRLRATVEQINGQSATNILQYDNNGNLEASQEPEGNINGFVYDGLNRLAFAINANQDAQFISYNELDQIELISMVDYEDNFSTIVSQIPTQFSNNAFGDVLQEISPDRGTTTYTYDAAGNMLTRTDARGITATYTYDALNRLTSITYPDTSENVTYIYDANPTGAITCTFGIGRLCRVEDESGITHFAYDEYGNVVDRVHVELGISYGHSFTYDNGDQLTQLTTSENRAINYARDAERRISEVSTSLNGQTVALASNLQYQPDGSEINVDFGNGLSESRAYDENGLLLSEATGQTIPQHNVPIPFWAIALLGGLLSAIAYLFIGKKQSLASSFILPLVITGFVLPDIALANQTIIYDLNKNIVSRQVDNGTTTYQYDMLNRLTNEAGNAATQSFTYDYNHNRLTDGIGSYSYTPSSNQMSAQHGNSITYDLAGNITDNGQGLTFEYNNAGRLKRVYDNAVLVATYTYNAFGQRTRKVTPSETTVYHYDLDGQLIEETLGDGMPQTTYTWRDNKPTSVIFKAGTPSNSSAQDKVVYLHNDHLNTPRSATNDTQTIVWSWESDAFGTAFSNTDPDGDGNDVFVNLRFAGQYFDLESGLHYNWNRYYDPNSGRYTTSDPIGLQGGQNTFIYVSNSPLNFLDPTGLQFDSDPLSSENSEDQCSCTPEKGKEIEFIRNYLGRTSAYMYETYANSTRRAREFSALNSVASVGTRGRLRLLSETLEVAIDADDKVKGVQHEAKALLEQARQKCLSR